MELIPTYKETELGVIPVDWEIASIGEIADVHVGRDLHEDRFSRICDFTYRFPVYSNTVADSGLYGFYSIPEYEGDSVTVVGRGVGLGTAFARKGAYGAVGRLLVLLPVEYADAQFLAVYINQRMRIFIETGGIPQLTGIQFSKYRVALPSLPEQRAIANTLTDVDALLEGLEQFIAKKRDLKLAAMQELLTGRTRLPGFTDNWRRLNMAEKSTLKARIGWHGLTTAEYLEFGQYFLVTGTDFVNGKVNWENCHFVSEHRYLQDRHIQLQLNDVLLTKDGTIGKVGFVDSLPGNATLNSGVFVIRPLGNSYDPKFLYYVLTSRIFDDFLNRLKAGSTISHLYQKDFVSFSFHAPSSIHEQTAIAAVLTDMDAELEALEQRLAKTRDLKQAMMYELLTGKTRLAVPEAVHA